MNAIADLMQLRHRQYGDRAEWVADLWDAIAAELAAALRVSRALASSYMTDADIMRERLPKVGECLGTSYGNIWGIPVLESTQCPLGYAAVASIRAGAGVFWQRMGLRLEYNPGYSDTMWSTNTYGFRVESRIALSVPRPGGLTDILLTPYGDFTLF